MSWNEYLPTLHTIVWWELNQAAWRKIQNLCSRSSLELYYMYSKALASCLCNSLSVYITCYDWMKIMREVRGGGEHIWRIIIKGKNGENPLLVPSWRLWWWWCECQVSLEAVLTVQCKNGYGERIYETKKMYLLEFPSAQRGGGMGEH